MQQETKTVTVKLPEALACRVKGMAKLRGLTLSELLTPVLDDLTKELEPLQAEWRARWAAMLETKDLEEMYGEDARG